MALTLTKNPGEYLPAYNDMTYIVSSTNIAQANFYVKVYIDYFDDATTYVNILEAKLFPLPGTDYVRYDPSDILRDFVSNDFAILRGTGTTGERSSAGEHYRIRFREFYGTPPTAQGTELTQSNFVFNGSLERREYTRYDENDYVANVTALARFLTPVDEVWMRDTDTYLLTIMSKTTGGIAIYTKLRVEQFDMAGASLGITDVSMLSPEAEIRNRFQSVRIGPAQIGVASNVDYYDVWAASASNVQRTEKFRIHIDRDCTKYMDQKIYWLNRLGGIDGINFPLVSRSIVETTRKTYNRPVGEAVSASNWALNSYDSERTAYSIKTRNKITLNTDFLNDTQSIMLKDLMTSGVIMWYDTEFSEWVSMQIERNEYETRKQINDGITSEELTLWESLENERQRC